MRIFECDGLFEDGCACWGWVFYNDDGSEAARGYGSFGTSSYAFHVTVNYEAVIQALRFAQENGIQNCQLRTDSMFVTEQIMGRWQAKTPELGKAMRTTRELMNKVGVHLRCVGPGEVDRAESLARIAFERVWERGSRFAVWEALAVEGNEVGS